MPAMTMSCASSGLTCISPSLRRVETTVPVPVRAMVRLAESRGEGFTSQAKPERIFPSKASWQGR